jgi:hypothetical protein
VAWEPPIPLFDPPDVPPFLPDLRFLLPTEGLNCPPEGIETRPGEIRSKSGNHVRQPVRGRGPGEPVICLIEWCEDHASGGPFNVFQNF